MNWLRVDVAGRTGVVARKDHAVQVRSGDGSQVLVTVDDARGGGATLNTLADRHQQRLAWPAAQAGSLPPWTTPPRASGR